MEIGENLEDAIRQAYRDRHHAWKITQRALPQLVCDSVTMEGLNYTVDEVSMIMKGLCVGERPLIEQKIIYNEILAWRVLLDSIMGNCFSVSKKFICDLRNFIIPIQMPNQFMDLGYFEKNTTLAAVALATFDPNSSVTDELWNRYMEKHKNILRHTKTQWSNFEIYNTALELFLDLVDAQFFAGGNERIARLMLNGVLIASGLPYIRMTDKRIEYYREDWKLSESDHFGRLDKKIFILNLIDIDILIKGLS